MKSQDILRQLEVGICTKDRWSMLRLTLEKIFAFGWGEMSIRIFDDGSEDPCPFDPRSICPSTTLTRFEQPGGYIVRRNQIAAVMSAPYYMSLDDDSYPLSGSVEEMIHCISQRPDLLCLSFPVYNTKRQEWQNCSLRQTPYQTRGFIGCGHVLRRSHFLEIGAYRETFVHQGEEGDLAYRGLLRGYKTLHYPGLTVEHAETATARNRGRMHYYGSRNKVLWNRLYRTRGGAAWSNFRALVERCKLAAVTPSLRHFTGFYDGLTANITDWSDRTVDREVLRAWLALPPS